MNKRVKFYKTIEVDNKTGESKSKIISEPFGYDVLDYIDKLETENQILINKLQEEVEKYQYTEFAVSNMNDFIAVGKKQEAQKILNFVKGE